MKKKKRRTKMSLYDQAANWYLGNGLQPPPIGSSSAYVMVQNYLATIYSKVDNSNKSTVKIHKPNLKSFNVKLPFDSRYFLKGEDK